MADESAESVRQRWIDAQQGHVFGFWDSLSSDEREHLLAQCRKIDLAEVAAIHERERQLAAGTHGAVDDFRPLECIDAVTDDAEISSAMRERGLAHVARGHVGVLLLAGGQGTRLGSSVPKGLFDVGLPSHKSLFQLQAERIRRLEHLAAATTGSETGHRIVWYILTSHATHDDTRRFFESKHFFGLQPEQIVMFRQRSMPATTPDGKIILESKSSLALAPNGNGGVYEALETEGVLEHMRQHSIETVFLYSVDNLLVRVADPLFIGYFLDKGYDCGAKVVSKRDETEKVGVLCLRNGRPSVVEYSEISKELSELRGDDGNLVFNAANICIHIYTRTFLEKVAAHHLGALPYHIAKKQIPSIDLEGNATKVDGWKFEKFVFDVFPESSSMLALKVNRSQEFSPLKNSAECDCPETCRQLISELHAGFIERAGGIVERTSDSYLCEVSPLVSYAGEGLEHLKGQTFQCPVHIQ